MRSLLPVLASLLPLVASVNFPYEAIQLTEAHVANFSAISFGDKSKIGAVFRSSRCKAYPGTTEWPLDEEWVKLNESMGGALLKPRPAASACYSGPFFDAQQCSFLMTGVRETRFYINDPLTVLTQWPQGDTCALSLKPTGNCTQGGFPVYVLNATTAAQIQMAVNFARNRNIRLVIKNTGHDFVGRSTGGGAISVWTHYLKSFEFLPEHTQENYNSMAARVGSGLEAWELYHYMDLHNMTLVVPGGSTVGAYGGWMAGGGHSILGSVYGLGSDQVLSLQVVTADGRLVTADPKTNPDLFYALRGGGGATYGIVTSAIVKAYPAVQVAETPIRFLVGNPTPYNGSASWNTSASPSTSDSLPTPTSPFPQFNQSRPNNRTNFAPGLILNSTTAFWAGIDAYFAFNAALCAAGGTGYNYINAQGPSGFSFRTNIELPNLSPIAARALLRPLFAALAAAGVPVPQPEPAVSLSWGSARKGQGDSPGNGRFGTRLFPRENFADSETRNRTVQAIRQVVEAGYSFHGVQIGAGAHTQGFPGNSSVNPALRAALMHADVFDRAPMRGASAGAAREARTRFEAHMELLRAVTPGGGAYVNEADALEPRWQESFWGGNYEALSRVKKEWDPWGVFWAPTTVGSEAWEVRNGREDGLPTQDGPLCRVEA